jgi:hypothetical protein
MTISVLAFGFVCMLIGATAGLVTAALCFAARDDQ